MTTMAECINLVRLRLGISQATYISDITIQSYLNFSASELYELLCNSNSDWNIARYSFTIPDNDPNTGFQLPIDFYKVLRVDRFLASNEAYILNRINIKDENLYGPSASTYTSGPGGYNTEVNSDGYTLLRVFPTSQKQGNYRILYYPQLPDYELSDTIKIGPQQMHWIEYMIVDTCIKICGQDETDPSLFLAQKAALILRITTSAAERDIGQAEPPPKAGQRWYEKSDFGGRNRNGNGGY